MVGGVAPRAIPTPLKEIRPLQRVAVVRRLQGLSRRAVARRMNIEVEEVHRQEQQATDLPLSVLLAWQKALGVPITELLVESDQFLATPVLERSQLVRLMKTVLAIRDQAKQQSIRRMAQTMSEQLTEIMPELANVAPWHVMGKRRRAHELGIAAGRHLTEDMFIDHGE
jgi:transcriptional regulator with XRE-family HTH domain